MRSDVIWRALPPVAAVVAVATGAPQAVAGGLALTGLAVATDFLVRRRSAGMADRVLVGVGGFLVALVLTGMLLGSTRLELSPTSWAVSLALLSGAELAVALALPARPASPTSSTSPAGTVDQVPVLRLLPWVAVAAVVVFSLVQTSGASLSAGLEPPVQMSFGRVAGTQVKVVVTSSDPVGPLEVRTSSDGTDISYPLFDITRDGAVTTTLSIPLNGRYVVTLNRPDQTIPLRTLILDR